jgi:hypothetical protein
MFGLIVVIPDKILFAKMAKMLTITLFLKQSSQEHHTNNSVIQ